jgi:hypothetical protein
MDEADDQQWLDMLEHSGLDVGEWDLSVPRAMLPSDWGGAYIAEDGALAVVLRFHPEWIRVIRHLYDHYLQDHSCEDVEAAAGSLLEILWKYMEPMTDAYMKYMQSIEGLGVVAAMFVDETDDEVL